MNSFFWLELGSGNITSGDELDFEVTELNIVYDDDDEVVSN